MIETNNPGAAPDGGETMTTVHVIEERMLKEHGIHRMKADPNCNYCKGSGERWFAGNEELIAAWIPCHCAFSNPTTQPYYFVKETLRRIVRQELARYLRIPDAAPRREDGEL